MENKALMIQGMSLHDIATKLWELEIPLTEENILAAATHIELIASAWAKATLQDMTRQDCIEWIEAFSPKEKEV